MIINPELLTKLEFLDDEILNQKDLTLQDLTLLSIAISLKRLADTYKGMKS